MRVPRLNRRMVLEVRRESANGSGGLRFEWEALGSHWVSVSPGAGRELVMGGVTQSELTLTLVLRATPHGSTARPAAGQRLREGARVFRILAVQEADPDQRYLTCLAKEETAA